MGPIPRIPGSPAGFNRVGFGFLGAGLGSPMRKAFVRGLSLSTACAASGVAILSLKPSSAHAKTVASAPQVDLKPLERAAVKNSSGPPTKVDADGRRIIAVGDVHGDLMQTLKALKLGGLIDATGSKWTGGKTILVQVGDILDRGDHELAILRLFKRLAKQAEKEGGAVYILNGNHEIMNVEGDFRYVTPGAFTAFAELYSKKHGADPKLQTLAGATYARRELLKPGSDLAKDMAKNPTVLQVGDTLFAHAGVLQEHVDYGLDKINMQVSGWMEGRYPGPPQQVKDENGVVWNRTFGGTAMYGPEGACPRLSEVLKSTTAKRMVIGHTPQESGANSECMGQLWRIDVGKSRGILGATPQVLEIIDNKVRIL